MIDYNQRVGRQDFLMITLDTLRYDVAQRLYEEGRTPTLARLLAPGGWQPHHSPGSFTFAAHSAFFAGFFPTPASPGPHARPFAARFQGSVTTTAHTCVLEAPDIVTGLAARGYHTICIGGVGFFNQQTPLGSVLPGLFAERHWRPAFGVTDPDSTHHQVQAALKCLEAVPPQRRVLLFINVSALHQPNRGYLPGAARDCLESHAAALEYVDAQLAPLFEALAARGDWHAFIGSDHGTAYGEDGYEGHRIGHEVVWTVPWAAFDLTAKDPTSH